METQKTCFIFFFFFNCEKSKKKNKKQNKTKNIKKKKHRLGDDHSCVPVEKTHPLEKNIKKIEKKTIVNVNKPKPTTQPQTQIQSQPSYNDTGAFSNPFANIMGTFDSNNNNNMSQWQQQQQQISAFQQFTHTNNNTNISHETQQQETELRDSNYNSQREMQEQLLKQIAENNEKFKWNCNFCTFENVGTATKCTVCDNPKDAVLIVFFCRELQKHIQSANKKKQKNRNQANNLQLKYWKISKC